MKIAVVTGANGQFGRFFVEKLLKRNFFVYSLDLNFSYKERINEKQIIVDISNHIEIEKFFLKVKKLDLLINNAGIGVFTPFEERTLDEVNDVIGVNLVGPIFMTKSALEIMKRQKYGKIINLASIYGVVSSDYRIYGTSGRNNSEIYTITKAGIVGFTKYLACHYAKYNIQINSISPGGVFNNQDESFVKNYENKTPGGRMATLGDFEDVLEFLISDNNSYTNGQNLVIDGGFTAW